MDIRTFLLRIFELFSLSTFKNCVINYYAELNIDIAKKIADGQIDHNYTIK